MPKSDGLRCLAIKQPWAWAVAAGAKEIENRSWSTDYRGPVVIQASGSKTEVTRTAKEHGLPGRSWAYGALIGIADLLDVTPLDVSLEKDPWASGPYCWRFGNARLFATPIPAKGKLNLYSLTAALAAKAKAAIATARRPASNEVGKAWLKTMRAADAHERELVHFDSYVELSDGANAVRIARRLVARERSAATLTELGRAQFLADDAAGALATLDEALRLDATSAEAEFLRSLISESLGEQ